MIIEGWSKDKVLSIDSIYRHQIAGQNYIG